MTGLLDRDFLMSRLAELLRGRQPENQQFAVLFIDVNNFKEVNDRHGHLIGDRVLAEAARRLSQCLPEGGHVVRFGGDEFVVLLERIAGKEEIRSVIETNRVGCRATDRSTGRRSVAVTQRRGGDASAEYRTPEELLSAADQAMYASRAAKARLNSQIQLRRNGLLPAPAAASLALLARGQIAIFAASFDPAGRVRLRFASRLNARIDSMRVTAITVHGAAGWPSARLQSVSAS